MVKAIKNVINGVVITSLDITEYKTLEAKLRQAQPGKKGGEP